MPTTAPPQPRHQRATAKPASRGSRGHGEMLRAFTLAHPFGPIQAKLTVGPAHDRFEAEADRVADHVMRVPDAEAAASASAGGADHPIRRKCEACTQQEAITTKGAVGATAEVPPGVQAGISALHGGGQPLSAGERAFFEPRFGYDFAQVRIHTDSRSAELARAVQARAFTVGQDVVFEHGEYAPSSDSGRRLLAHELAHTVQQRGAVMPPQGSLGIAAPGEAHERAAEQVARSVTQSPDGRAANDGEVDDSPKAALDASPVAVARLQRVISFTTAAGTFTPHDVVANEDAAGFVLTSPPGTFQWEPDVTIHGDATDVFADWETAHHQVGKGFWFNVWWGTGADRTHRGRRIRGGLPMRDATAAGNTWYSDWRAQRFAADGDVRSPVMRDTPSTGRIPWNNPIAGRGGTRGWFNYGFGFVSTLSARHIPDGTGAAAFRHFNHVHWNFMVDGTFDNTRPIPGRVTLNGGTVNRSNVIPGVDVDNRPMHGTPIINDNFETTDT